MITSQVRTTVELNPGDRGFLIRDGHMLIPRAGIRIDSKCPPSYRMMIATWIESGWIRPTAHVREHELMWDIIKGVTHQDDA